MVYTFVAFIQKLKNKVEFKIVINKQKKTVFLIILVFYIFNECQNYTICDNPNNKDVDNILNTYLCMWVFKRIYYYNTKYYTPKRKKNHNYKNYCKLNDLLFNTSKLHIRLGLCGR